MNKTKKKKLKEIEQQETIWKWKSKNGESNLEEK